MVKSNKKLRIENNLPINIYLTINKHPGIHNDTLEINFYDTRPADIDKVRNILPNTAMEIILRRPTNLDFKMRTKRKIWASNCSTDYGWLTSFENFERGEN